MNLEQAIHSSPSQLDAPKGSRISRGSEQSELRLTESNATPLSRFLFTLRKEKSLSGIICDDARISWLSEYERSKTRCSLNSSSLSNRWGNSSPSETKRTAPLPELDSPPPPRNGTMKRVSSPSVIPARKILAKRKFRRAVSASDILTTASIADQNTKSNKTKNQMLGSIDDMAAPRLSLTTESRQTLSRWNACEDEGLSKRHALPPASLSRRLSPIKDTSGKKLVFCKVKLPESLRQLPECNCVDL